MTSWFNGSDDKYTVCDPYKNDFISIHLNHMVLKGPGPLFNGVGVELSLK